MIKKNPATNQCGWPGFDSIITATYGTDAIYEDTTNQAFTVQSMALDGTATTTTYTALDANGTSALSLNGGTITEDGLTAGVNNASLTLPTSGGTNSLRVARVGAVQRD